MAPAEGRQLEIGIYLPQVSMDYGDILRRTRTAEDAGLHSVWFYDHLYSPGQPDLASLESWTLASFLLAQTRRIRVGHLVLCNNFRHPVVLAKMATTLDVLSEGRLELGLGSGSVEVEHHQAGLPWGTAAERAERLGEALQIVTSMLGGGLTSFAGHHYRVDSMPNLPPAVQRPRPPLHVGGVGRRHTLPLVARYADVWSIPTYGLDRWEEAGRALAEECDRIGRDPATIRRSHEAVLVLAPDDPSLAEARASAERRYGAPGWGLDAGGYVGTPPMVAERIAAAAERGITSFVFFTHDRGDPRTLELLGEQVLPLL